MNTLPKCFKLRTPLLSNYIRQKRYTIAANDIQGRVLDIGCGHAWILDTMPHITHYVGLDSHSMFLDHAKKRHPQQAFYRINVEDQLIPPEVLENQFDTVVLFALLEHLAQPQHIVDQIKQVLAPQGRIIATTPTPFGHKVHQIGAKLGLFYYEAAEDHKTVFNRIALEQLFHKAGINTVRYRTFELGCNQLIVGSVG